ncbi:MAG: hypothetical protein ABI781_10870, partial [Burkholderiales bacterium]
MTEELFLNTGVNLVVGLALLLVWNSERRQQFSRWLGLSFLVQAISPPAFLAWQAGPPPWSAIGFGALLIAASTSLTLWMVGAAHLAGRPLGKGRIAMGVVGLIATGGIVLEYDPRLAQAFGATLTTLAAIVALTWLHRLGRYERVAGIAMVLLGVNQFIWVVQGNAGLPLQAGLATLLRVVLGLALLHAAVSLGRGEAGQLRDQFSHLIERSHQGLAVMQGEVM